MLLPVKKPYLPYFVNNEGIQADRINETHCIINTLSFSLTVCMLHMYIYRICTVCVLYIYCTYILHLPCVYCICTVRIRCIYCMCTVYVLYVYCNVMYVYSTSNYKLHSLISIFNKYFKDIK